MDLESAEEESAERVGGGRNRGWKPIVVNLSLKPEEHGPVGAERAARGNASGGTDLEPARKLWNRSPSRNPNGIGARGRARRAVESEAETEAEAEAESPEAEAEAAELEPRLMEADRRV